MPVLTLVAPCGVTISSPILSRKEALKMQLKFMVSNAGQQESIKFQIPPVLAKSLPASPLVITSGPSSSCPDTYTSYIVRSTSPELNLMWIKVFHLSVQGCFTLHTRSVYSPPRPAPTAEIHILGLSAARHTTYPIVHQDPDYIGIKLLAHNDLQAVGWKRNPKKIHSPWRQNPSIFLPKTPLMEQMQHAPPSFFCDINVMSLTTKKVIPISDHSLVPLHYPQPVTHIPPKSAPIQPLFFSLHLPPIVTRKSTAFTVGQLINHLMPPPDLTKKEYFLTMYNVPKFTVLDEAILQHNLHDFLNMYAYRDNDTNGLCNFRHVRSLKEPFIFTIPQDWAYLTEQGIIKTESQRNQFPATEDHDWAY